jgi:hypothetical protein
VLRKEWSIVGWFKGSRRGGRHASGPTRRERRAAERTAKAEASLRETEQKIHQLADEVRADLEGSS